jgi:hypothetical protein
MSKRVKVTTRWAGEWPNITDTRLKSLSLKQEKSYTTSYSCIVLYPLFTSPRLTTLPDVTDCETIHQYLKDFESHKESITSKQWIEIQEELDADWIDSTPDGEILRSPRYGLSKQVYNHYHRCRRAMNKILEGYAGVVEVKEIVEEVCFAR